MKKLTVSDVRKIIIDEHVRQQRELSVYNCVREAVSKWDGKKCNKRIAKDVERAIETKFGSGIWKHAYSSVWYGLEYGSYRLRLNINRGEGQSDFTIYLGRANITQDGFNLEEFDDSNTCWSANAERMKQLLEDYDNTDKLKEYVKQHNKFIEAVTYFNKNYSANREFDYEVRQAFPREGED